MEWSQLPQEYQDLAKDFPKEADFKLFTKNEYGFDRLRAMFIFKETKQGHSFWYKCYEAESIDQLPQIPIICKSKQNV